MLNQCFTRCRILLFFVSLNFLYGCATNPVTGKRELSLLSFDREIELGREADPGIVAQYGLYNDEKISEYVNELGQDMAKISHRPNLEFTFRVLDSPVINAFALPGGYIYFTRGILAYMNSTAEVAGVMGHEIGHVTARHGAKAYTRAQLAQVGLTAGYIFSETFRQFSDVAQMGVGLLFLSFSRDQESQSDELGVAYSTTVGYDAQNMSHFFGTLNRLQEQSGQSLPGWFSTHPNPADREKRTLELARNAQQTSTLKEFKTERDRHLDLIDGMVYGEDPRQGFVENSYFYHPELDFQFPVPADWQLVNTPQVVQMVNKDQTAGIQFTLAKEPSALSAADKFVAESKAELANSKATRTNGYTTEIRETIISAQDGKLRVLSYFIEKDRKVYVFHGFARTNKFGENQNAFIYTMSNFDRLRNESARNVQPTRVDVVRVDSATTLGDFLMKHPSKEATPETLAVVNGMKLTDPLRPGDRVKVLTK
ncbi:M48 family metalloprotease [bacterium]|nr:M48 family metalloprotease [bacterium]